MRGGRSAGHAAAISAGQLSAASMPSKTTLSGFGVIAASSRASTDATWASQPGRASGPIRWLNPAASRRISTRPSTPSCAKNGPTPTSSSPLNTSTTRSFIFESLASSHHDSIQAGAQNGLETSTASASHPARCGDNAPASSKTAARSGSEGAEMDAGGWLTGDRGVA